MAVFKCEKCGATKDGRCKPQKCPVCGQKGCMQKA
jgi:rubrerythrin